jgi:hypothetical protein
MDRIARIARIAFSRAAPVNLGQPLRGTRTGIIASAPYAFGAFVRSGWLTPQGAISQYPMNSLIKGERLASTSSQKSQQVCLAFKVLVRRLLKISPTFRKIPPSASKSNSKHKQKTKQSSRPQDKHTPKQFRTHLEAFFAQHPTFKYDPTKPYMGEFYRMTNQFGWDSNGDLDQRARFHEARKGINEASVRQFNEIFGKDENDLASWRNLCSVLEIAKIPKSLNGCREVRNHG